ncbi:hypothetical protein PM082_007855 [Marasmius tenuissimus]|nr:hypothetical protein PM082_007855 [Marasmius tenuissimus]
MAKRPRKTILTRRSSVKLGPAHGMEGTISITTASTEIILGDLSCIPSIPKNSLGVPTQIYAITLGIRVFQRFREFANKRLDSRTTPKTRVLDSGLKQYPYLTMAGYLWILTIVIDPQA